MCSFELKCRISYLNGLEDGNGGKFTKSQVFGMMKSAKKAWGRVSTWSSDKLKSMASLSNRIPVQDIAQLDPTNVRKSICKNDGIYSDHAVMCGYSLLVLLRSGQIGGNMVPSQV